MKWHGVHKGSRLFLITPEELKALGKDPEVAVKAPVDWGKKLRSLLNSITN